MTQASTKTLPHFRRIKQWVIDNIASGEWKAGELIQPEDRLAEFHKVSKGTVRRAMDELQFEGVIDRQHGRGTFVAKPSARSHVKQHWAMICRYRHANYGDQTIAGIESLALESASDVVVEYVGDSRDRFRRAVKRLLGSKVSGFMIEALPYEAKPVALYRPILEAGAPLVLVRTPVAGLGAPLVTYNHPRIGREITQHLIETGHRRIGYVSSPLYYAVEQELLGYRGAIEAAGIAADERWVSLEEGLSDDRGYHATRKLLRLKNPPTAIIALNDATAANAYRAVKEAGLRIPQDISVVASIGLGASLPGVLDPPLTVWCPGETAFRLGETAARVLQGQLDGSWPGDENEVLVEPAPIPRGSVAIARDGAD